MPSYFVSKSASDILAHTYLQDLESFLWIVIDITHNFHGPGNDPLFHPRSNILPWMNPSYNCPELASSTITQKRDFLLNTTLSCPRDNTTVTYYFNGLTFKKLLHSLYSFFTSRYTAYIYEKDTAATVNTPWSKVFAQSIKDYDTILGYFETAINELRVEESKTRLMDMKRKRSLQDSGVALKRRREHE